MTGTIAVQGSSYETCTRLASGYEDIEAGDVEVLNASGTTVAKGRLRAAGAPVDTTSETTGAKIIVCTFPFSIDVPGGEKFYKLQIGQRTTESYSQEELKEPIELSLGL